MPGKGRQIRGCWGLFSLATRPAGALIPGGPPTGLETMAGVQLLTAQGQALETGQHLPEEARFREALVERQPHGPHADPDPHADLEQLQADRAALRPRQPRARQAPAPQ